MTGTEASKLEVLKCTVEKPMEERCNQEELQMWSQVEQSHFDLGNWEKLVRNYDSRISAFASKSRLKSEEGQVAQEGLRLSLNGLLARFPLCYGYWIRLIEFENSIIKQSLEAFPNSVDLWLYHCEFTIANNAHNDQAITRELERAAEHVGLDFQAHSFWDKFIDYEMAFAADINNYSRLFALLNRILLIPMQQISRYYDKYQQFAALRIGTELLSKDKYEKVMEEVRRALQAERRGKVGEEEVIAVTKAKIIEKTHLAYLNTEAATRKRWVFEETIKRPYFHIKPLDGTQLMNWHKYLDFEEAERDKKRIVTLYERCLVPCAYYEEFWERLALYLKRQGDVDVVRTVYSRACDKFVPAHQPGIRLSRACFLEEQNEIDRAREAFENVYAASSSHIDSVLKYANFERRQGNVNKAAEIYESSIEKLQGVELATVSVHFAQFASFVQGNDQKAKSIFKDSLSKCGCVKVIAFNYLIWLSNVKSDSEADLVDLFAAVKASDLDSGSKRDFAKALLRTLNDRSHSIASVSRVELFLTELAAEKKHPAEMMKMPSSKMPKLDGQSAASAWIAQSGF